MPGYTYLWSNGFTNASISGLTAGSYTVSVTDANGCVKSKTFNITQNPPMILIAVPSGPTSATANISGGIAPYTYFWNTAPAQTTGTATGLTPGNTYKVKVNDSKGCSKIAFVTIPLPKATAAFLPLGVNVFPNPASTVINIQIINSWDLNAEIKLMDNLGKIVIQKSVDGSGNMLERELNISTLPKGIYLLQVISGKQIKVVKVARISIQNFGSKIERPAQ